MKKTNKELYELVKENPNWEDEEGNSWFNYHEWAQDDFDDSHLSDEDLVNSGLYKYSDPTQQDIYFDYDPSRFIANYEKQEAENLKEQERQAWRDNLEKESAEDWEALEQLADELGMEDGGSVTDRLKRGAYSRDDNGLISVPKRKQSVTEAVKKSDGTHSKLFNKWAKEQNKEELLEKVLDKDIELSPDGKQTKGDAKPISNKFADKIAKDTKSHLAEALPALINEKGWIK